MVVALGCSVMVLSPKLNWYWSMVWPVALPWPVTVTVSGISPWVGLPVSLRQATVLGVGDGEGDGDGEGLGGGGGVGLGGSFLNTRLPQ